MRDIRLSFVGDTGPLSQREPWDEKIRLPADQALGRLKGVAIIDNDGAMHVYGPYVLGGWTWYTVAEPDKKTGVIKLTSDPQQMAWSEHPFMEALGVLLGGEPKPPDEDDVSGDDPPDIGPAGGAEARQEV